MRNKIIKKETLFMALKYMISAAFCFFVDITLFTIFNIIIKRKIGSLSIIVSTIIARAISSVINYYINRNKVFNQQDGKIDKRSFNGFILLVITQMCVSFSAVYLIYNAIHINESIIKFLVECILFIVNFFIQKLLIFKKKEK